MQVACAIETSASASSQVTVGMTPDRSNLGTEPAEWRRHPWISSAPPWRSLRVTSEAGGSRAVPRRILKAAGIPSQAVSARRAKRGSGDELNWDDSLPTDCPTNTRPHRVESLEVRPTRA